MDYLQNAASLIAVSAADFTLIDKPLSKIDYTDPTLIVNPTGYYTGRWTMIGVTALYAAVDATVVCAVKRCYWIGTNPALAVDAAARRLPGWVIDVEERRPAAGGRPSTIHLRAGIETIVFLLTIILTIVFLLTIILTFVLWLLAG